MGIDVDGGGSGELAPFTSVVDEAGSFAGVEEVETSV